MSHDMPMGSIKPIARLPCWHLFEVFHHAVALDRVNIRQPNRSFWCAESEENLSLFGARSGRDENDEISASWWSSMRIIPFLGMERKD